MSRKNVTLEEAVARVVELGYDPIKGADDIEKRYGIDWILDQLRPYAHDLVAERIRQELNNRRRHDVAKLERKRGQRKNASTDLKLKRMYVPSREGYPVYVRIADATAEDFERRAAYLESMASNVMNQAEWHRRVASLMRKMKAKTANEIKEFPPLPSDDDLSFGKAA